MVCSDNPRRFKKTERTVKMAKICRHRKGIILATAGYVEFRPDQEPFTSGVIESCGIETIVIPAINIHYCPKCNAVKTDDITIDCEPIVYES